MNSLDGADEPAKRAFDKVIKPECNSYEIYGPQMLMAAKSLSSVM